MLTELLYDDVNVISSLAFAVADRDIYWDYSVRIFARVPTFSLIVGADAVEFDASRKIDVHSLYLVVLTV